MSEDLHLPDGPARASAVVLHPHPGMGGDRHHPLVVAVAERLTAIGVVTLRPDLVDPDPDRAGSRLEALADELRAGQGTDALLLVGYSWGSVVAASADPRGLVARVLVAPPASMLEAAPARGGPALVLVPAHDQFGPPDAVRELLGAREATTIEVVEGCDHFLAGAVDRIAARAVGWLEAQLPA